jgi:2-furoyl-CoA dehydrogenase FAD binding subunit
MKPARFDYLRAENTAHALEALSYAGEDARLLAGGQSLMAVLNMRLASPGLLVDISRTAELDRLDHDASRRELVVGAAVTQARVEWRTELADEVPLLKKAFPHISHFQIRNRGTVCGSIAHADPSAELPLVLCALDGAVTLRSASGRRRVAARDLFQGMLMTARRPDELIESAHFPTRKAGQRFGFEEFSARHGDFALVAVASVVTDDQIRLAVGGVADRPMVARWSHLEGDQLRDAINDFSWQLDAQDDANVSAAYRRHLVRELSWRAISSATS